jgi:glycosyltransferase involved in cell wall biosynthesis
MATQPEFSIVLCTRNRAELLAHALESLCAIDYPVDDVELVLVDNGSTDETREVVERSAGGFPFALRYVHEVKPGLSVARNRGIAEARGRFLLFTDDDQLVDRGILQEYSRVRARYGARVVQGAIDLRFTESPPEWLRGPLASYFGKTPERDEGPMQGDLHGGNMLLSRGLFTGEAGFREDLGKGAVGYCEDTELSGRLRAKGEIFYFAPRARQWHVIGPDRLDPGFIRRTSFEKGLSHGLLLDAGTPVLRAANRTLKDAWGHARQAARAGLRSDQHGRLLSEVRAMYEVGRLLGYARRSLRRLKREAP